MPFHAQTAQGTNHAQGLSSVLFLFGRLASTRGLCGFHHATVLPCIDGATRDARSGGMMTKEKRPSPHQSGPLTSWKTGANKSQTRPPIARAKDVHFGAVNLFSLSRFLQRRSRAVLHHRQGRQPCRVASCVDLGAWGLGDLGTCNGGRPSCVALHMQRNKTSRSNHRGPAGRSGGGRLLAGYPSLLFGLDLALIWIFALHVASSSFFQREVLSKGGGKEGVDQRFLRLGCTNHGSRWNPSGVAGCSQQAEHNTSHVEWEGDGGTDMSTSGSSSVSCHVCLL